MRLALFVLVFLAACSPASHSVDSGPVAMDVAVGVDAGAMDAVALFEELVAMDDVAVLEWPATPVAATSFIENLPAATEGLVFDGSGRLYLSTTSGKILAVDASGDVVATYALLPLPEGAKEGTAGLAIGPDNGLYVCRYDASRIERLSLTPPHEVTVFLDIETPNTLLFGPGGDLWFTSSGGHSSFDGHVGRLKLGAALPEVVINHVKYANGLAFLPDQSALFVTSTDPGQLLRIPLDEFGNPGAAQVLADGPEMAIVDGLAMAPDGTLLVAGFGTGRIYAWRGEELVTLVAPPAGESYFGTASLAFGAGEGFPATTLYFTNLMTPVVRQVSF